MGICASFPSTEIHDDAYGNENAVYFSGISTNSSQIIGSTYSHTGTKGVNQDSALLFQDYGIEDGVFCGVFDGHGRNGHTVSKIVRNRLPSLLLNQTNYTTKNDRKLENNESKNVLKWKEGCTAAFRVIDKEIKLLDKLDCLCSGTTAVVVVKQKEELVIANLGDSRAVLGTRTGNRIMAVQLTTDLKPGVPCEAERIRKHKGRILSLKDEQHVDRVWLPYDDSPGLAMSRAFGDFVLKPHGVICDPVVTYHRLSSNDEFVVLASDGVWDVLSNEQVVSIVSRTDGEEAAARAVVDAAITCWKYKFSESKRDDCTVVCLFLQK